MAKPELAGADLRANAWNQAIFVIRAATAEQRWTLRASACYDIFVFGFEKAQIELLGREGGSDT